MTSATAGVRSKSAVVPRICARLSTRLMPRDRATCWATCSMVRLICIMTYWPASWMIRFRSPNGAALRSPAPGFPFPSPDLLRRQLGAFVGERLAQIAQRHLLLLGVLIQLLAAGVQFLVGRLIGGRDPQHVGHRQDADDGGRGCLTPSGWAEFPAPAEAGTAAAARRRWPDRRRYRRAAAARRVRRTEPARAGTRARRGRCGGRMCLSRHEPLPILRLLGDAGSRGRTSARLQRLRRSVRRNGLFCHFEPLEPGTETKPENLRLVAWLLYHKRRQVNVYQAESGPPGDADAGTDARRGGGRNLAA